MDLLGKNADGKLTFDGTAVAASNSALATDTTPGIVIIGSGITADPDGTIHIDWYSSTDNGDGTHTITIGDSSYTQDDATGTITDSKVNGISLGTTIARDAAGNTIKTETVGSTVITTITDPGGRLIRSETVQNGILSTVVYDGNGAVIYSLIGDILVSGTKEEAHTNTVVNADGSTTTAQTTITKTPNSQTQTITETTVNTDGSISTTVTEISGAANVNNGLAAGTATTTVADSSGNITGIMTNPVLTNNGNNFLVTENDIDDLMNSITGGW